MPYTHVLRVLLRKEHEDSSAVPSMQYTRLNVVNDANTDPVDPQRVSVFRDGFDAAYGVSCLF